MPRPRRREATSPVSWSRGHAARSSHVSAVSTASSCTWPTATCCTSSCRRSTTGVRTTTAAISRDAPGFLERYCARSGRGSGTTSPSGSASSRTTSIPRGSTPIRRASRSPPAVGGACGLHRPRRRRLPQRALRVPVVGHARRLAADEVAAVKEANADVPVFGVGAAASVEEAAEVVDSGIADMVALTRAQLADPDLALKLREGGPPRSPTASGSTRAAWAAEPGPAGVLHRQPHGGPRAGAAAASPYGESPAVAGRGRRPGGHARRGGARP